MKNLVGPGIAQAEYGGALFLFPPRPIPDVWTDPRLDFTDTLEERLLAAAFLHSRERHVAVVSPKIPPASLAAAGPAVRPQDRPPAAEAVQRPAPRAAADVPRPQRQARSGRTRRISSGICEDPTRRSLAIERIRA